MISKKHTLPSYGIGPPNVDGMSFNVCKILGWAWKIQSRIEKKLKEMYMYSQTYEPERLRTHIQCLYCRENTERAIYS